MSYYPKKITWNLYTVAGDSIWTDGTDVYYSTGSMQYKLNRETNSWDSTSWTGLHVSLDGFRVWKDTDNNVYYSYRDDQYARNKNTNEWAIIVSWTVGTGSDVESLSSLDGSAIWTDGVDTYYSRGSKQLVLNKNAKYNWLKKEWKGLTVFNSQFNCIWTDGTKIYYSENTNHYVLNKATDTWEPKTWNGLTNFLGTYVWTDGMTAYYSNGASQYKLNKDTDTWEPITWDNGLTNFHGNYVWTDPVTKNIYSSEGTTQWIIKKYYTPDTSIKFIDKSGLAKVVSLIKDGKKRTFIGTQDEWDALTTAQKNVYDIAKIITEE